LINTYFAHEKALVESQKVGAGTRVWAFAHILPGAVIGEDCNICDGVFVENDVVVGERVTVKCGVQLWDGTRVGNDVFIGPNATLTNDKFPRSKIYPDQFPQIVLEDNCSIGANATILPGIRIGKFAMVGAGAVVTRDVPPNTVVAGNPARIISYIGTNSPNVESLSPTVPQNSKTTLINLKSGASLIRLPEKPDLRGNLSFAEIGQYLPFKVERYFLVYDVPSEEIRGEHAHIDCHQFLVCVKGKVSVVTDNSECRDQIVLDSPTLALHIPPMVWGVQYKYSKDAVLMVLASHKYAASDYIRDYSEFQEKVKNKQTRG
jgi:UDP-2-acetamido-3-amino-2,3-dideoxy-glucuronate N-acetyltransferase